MFNRNKNFIEFNNPLTNDNQVVIVNNSGELEPFDLSGQSKILCFHNGEIEKTQALFNVTENQWLQCAYNVIEITGTTPVNLETFKKHILIDFDGVFLFEIQASPFAEFMVSIDNNTFNSSTITGNTTFISNLTNNSNVTITTNATALFTIVLKKLD